MKTLQQIFDKIEEAEISIYNYSENGELCGYELNTYTQGGVNQIVFLDFRNTEMNPENAQDFLTVYNERVNSIEIDEEIELNRQMKGYKDAFSLSESVQDFEEWKEKLENIFSKPTKKTAQQRQFEQVQDKLRSQLAEMEEILKLMPKKGDRPSTCQRTEISNILGGLDHCINGIELEDFTPNEYSGDWQLSYS